MSRSSNNLNNSWCLLLLSALTAALLWLTPVRSVRAAVYTYNARQRTINAGVLFAGSAADLAFSNVAVNGAVVPDPAPYVFRVLDLRPDVKPVGWTFVNPLAPSTVTAAINTRWNGAYASVTGVTPDMAAYWEVALRDVSADDLQQFDVLYLPGSYLVGTSVYPVTLTPADNEKLRRFVDNGGQLIVEYGIGANSQPNFAGSLSLFNSPVWQAGPAATSLAFPAAGTGFDLHPLITQPNFLTLSDFSFLGASSPDTTFGTITQTNNLNDIFGTVLLQGARDGVEAAQLGAGEIVTSALNIGPTVSISQGAFFNSGPFFAQASYLNGSTAYSPSVVPSVDLKFLSNILSWEDTHPAENKTSHQNAAGPSSASFAAAWSYPLPSQAKTPPPGGAVWGNYVFVTDAAGTVHAFDAIPDEFLTLGTSADDGLGDFVNPTAPASPSPYDEVWHVSVVAGASAPTVASYGGSTFVFVEKTDGSVVQYNSVTGVLAGTLTPASGTPAFPSGVPVPAPTYYDGRIYASQADGSLFIYSLNKQGSAGGGIVIPVNPTKTDGEYATAAPAVGLLASGTGNNTIVALVPTTQNMNTVLLGARNDPLTSYSANGQFTGYNVDRAARYRLFNLFVDATSAPGGRAYDGNGNVVVQGVTGGQDPVFGSTNPSLNGDGFYGDWDADFSASTGQNTGGPPNGTTLTLHEIKALSLANTGGGSAVLSAPAIDRHGDYYYVVNAGVDSYLFGVHDDIQQNRVLLKFRFRLPKTGDVSAKDAGGNPWDNVDRDNVHYDGSSSSGSGQVAANRNGATNSLLDFKFVGAPVVDGQGNVYVAAQGGTQTINGAATATAAVLCFNANQAITAEPRAIPAGFDATVASYYQLDESDGTTQNPIASRPVNQQGAGRIGQISTAGVQATVFNFGRGSGGARQISGNLCEPQPFTGTTNANGTSVTSTMYFHTNMAWYATFAVNGSVSGLTKAGSKVLLCDSGNGTALYNTLYKLPAAPTVGAGKVAALTVLRSPLGTGVGGLPLNIGAVLAAPSAGGGAMVINGSQGVAAFNQQLTLIADNNRILEVDSDGNAVWSADATTRIQSPSNPNSLTTKVDFAHPSALTQFAPNDYLVADTGNNRCVRFDRGGGVLWELTRFYDPSGLMAPGQPLTLSQPTSVEVRHETYGYTDPVKKTSAVGQLVHYLVADAGNDRIVEVTDTLDAAGNVLYFNTNNPPTVVAPGTNGSVTHDHLLTWVTHTGDKYGRRYHYAGASYLDIPSSPEVLEVLALVTNTRVAQLNGGQVAPASADAPGGSIVGFNRPLFNQTLGLPGPKPFSTLGPTDNDLVYVATSFTSGTGSNLANFQVRNPRFLHVFAPPQGTPASVTAYKYSFLYADDNGAFDLVYQSPAANGQPTPPTSYGLAFTQNDYRNMSLTSNVSADFQGNVPLRGGAPASGNTPAVPPIPFVPTCVQRLNSDNTNIPGFSHIERYLITQSYSQGELARQPGATGPSRLGGEIFEVDVSTDATTGIVAVNPIGGFGAAVTLSHPVGASPLTQPTFAIRTTQ